MHIWHRRNWSRPAATVVNELKRPANCSIHSYRKIMFASTVFLFVWIKLRAPQLPLKPFYVVSMKQSWSSINDVWISFLTDKEDFIQCYSCQYSYNPTWDTSCVDATGIPSISCAPNRVCTVHTQYDTCKLPFKYHFSNITISALTNCL